jgi:CRP/FNR family transcriptional regulator, dissimilatory nitrate respiration regulator
MHTARPGELFAEASIFSTHYHCDAIAMQDCEVLVYQKADLIRRLKEDQEAMWAFTAELAQRIQGLRTRLELRQTRSATERLLQYLRLKGDASGTWRPEGPLKQLAEEVGLTHEALYRALAKLEHNGHISRSSSEIRLLRKI